MNVDNVNDYNEKNLTGKFLCRYINLMKLIDLLENGRIYFTRLDNFEDGLEGITGKGAILRHTTPKEPTTKDNINPTFPDELKEAIIKDDDSRIQGGKESLQSLESSQQTQFASCWFFEERESMAMWKIYSQKDGVLIRFDALELINIIKIAAESYTNSDFVEFYYGKIEYKKINPLDFKEKFEQKYNGLKKDKSFEFENEFRFVAGVPIEMKGKHNYFSLPIGDLKTYNFKIISSPYMENCCFESIKKLLAKYGLDDKFEKSKMVLRKQ